MGVACSDLKKQKPETQETGDKPSSPGSARGSKSQAPGSARGDETPFQPKAALKVKAGGFGAAALVTSNRGVFEQLYTVEDALLGEGTYSVVNKCVKKQTNQSFAVKKIQRKHMRRPNQFEYEFTVLRILDHPNVLRMVESFEDEDAIYLVTELCQGGQLFDTIVDRGQAPERSVAIIITQILRAINYLHSNNIVHRDIKAENFFLAEDQLPEATTIKLGDFGLAKPCGPDDLCSTKAGTPYYVAPEILEGQYTNKVDLWAAGVIFYMLIGGAPPFSGANTVEVFEQVKAAKINVKKLGRPVSDDCRDLLLGLIEKDPAKRITASTALNSNWLVKMMQPFEFGAQRGSAIRGAAKAGNFGGSLPHIAEGLKAYSESTPMQKAMLHAVASQLSREALADLEQAFLQVDLNKDGTLSLDEFKEGMKRSGVDIAPDQVLGIFKGIDADGSGRIDYSEFVAAMMDSQRTAKEDACFKAFSLFDLDGSGNVDRAELTKLLQNDNVAGLSARDIDALYADVELQSGVDPYIGFEEFMAMMNKMDRSGTAFPALEEIQKARAALRKSARGSARSGGRNSGRLSGRESPRGSVRGGDSARGGESGRASGRKTTAEKDSARKSGRK